MTPHAYIQGWSYFKKLLNKCLHNGKYAIDMEFLSVNKYPFFIFVNIKCINFRSDCKPSHFIISSIKNICAYFSHFIEENDRKNGVTQTTKTRK